MSPTFIFEIRLNVHVFIKVVISELSFLCLFLSMIKNKQVMNEKQQLKCLNSNREATKCLCDV